MMFRTSRSIKQNSIPSDDYQMCRQPSILVGAYAACAESADHHQIISKIFLSFIYSADPVHLFLLTSVQTFIRLQESEIIVADWPYFAMQQVD
jgi:hypothetical protein